MKVRHAILLLLSAFACLAGVSARAEHAEQEEGRFWLRMHEYRENADRERRPRIERIEQRRSQSSLRRMSPEERHQLRLDIRAAREGVYRRPPPPRQPSPPPFPEPPH